MFTNLPYKATDESASQEKSSFSTNAQSAPSGPSFNPATGGSNFSTSGFSLNAMDKPTLALIILGVICFIDYFLPWNTVSVFFAYITIPGYYGWGSFVILLLIAFFVWIGLSLSNVQIPLNQNQKRLIRLGLTLGIAFFTLLRILFYFGGGLTVEGWIGFLTALSIGGIDGYLYLKENKLILGNQLNPPYNQPNQNQTQNQTMAPPLPQNPETINPSNLQNQNMNQQAQSFSSTPSNNQEAAKGFCPNCGREIKSADVFCGNCGQRLIT